LAKFKVGIVGLSRGKGYVGVFAAHPRVEVAAVCDIDEDKLNIVGDAFKLEDKHLYKNYDEFINDDFDIVVIASPIPMHTEHTLKALAAGKHVLCEQTVAYTVDECEQVIEAVKKSKKTYMMAENYCYFYFIQEWKKIIKEGRLGKIIYAEAEYIHNIEEILIDKETGKRFWRNLRAPIWYCAHPIGPILFLTDDKIIKASGRHCGFNRWPDKEKELGFLDMEVGIFETENGMIFKILRSQVAAHHHMVWYSLYGTKGSLENQRIRNQNGIQCIEDETGIDKQIQFGEKPELIQPGYESFASFVPTGIDENKKGGELIQHKLVDPSAPKDAYVGLHGTSEYYLIRDFIDSIENKTKPPIDVIRSVEFTIPGIIAHESALNNGEWKDVPQYTW
jgi:predicted dehydrogenase